MFKGAALSGFVSGFGDEFAKGISERQERFDKYEDQQIATAKAKEPYLAKDRASADSAILMMNNLKRDFGLSNEDFIGLAQSNTDIESVYKSIYTAQKQYDNMPNGGKLSRADIMGTLKIPENFEIPQGVTAEDMIYKIFTNNAYNLSQDPNNKSEEHKANSFGKAISSALMLNPKTSAREAVNNMEIMGIRGENLLNYTPGQRGTAIEGLQASPFTLPDIEYDKDQLVRTSNRYEKDILQSFGALDANGNIRLDEKGLNKVLTVDGDKMNGLQKARRAGSSFAKLETMILSQGLDLGFGIGNKRNAVLQDIAIEINTKEEVDNFIKNVNNGSASRLIIEAFKANGNIDDTTIDAILGTVSDSSSDTAKVDPLSNVSPNPALLNGNTSASISTDTSTMSVAERLAANAVSGGKNIPASDLSNLDIKDATYNEEENAWYDNLTKKKILDPKGSLKNAPGFRKLEDSSFMDGVMSFIGGDMAKDYFANKPKEKDNVAKVEEKAEDKGIMTSPKLRPSDLKIEKIIEEKLEPEEASNLKEQFNANPKDSIWESIVRVMSSKEYARIQSDKRMDEAIQKIKESRPELRTKRPDAIGFTLSDLRSILDSELPDAQKAMAIKIMASIKPNTAGLKIGTK
jgi:hypothetical protein